MEINILRSESADIRFFIQNAYQNNISSCTMLNHIFNSSIKTLQGNDDININTVHLFVKQLVLATSYIYTQVTLYYPKYENLVIFFTPILNIHRILQIHTSLLVLFPTVIIQIIFKYSKIEPKKVLTLPQIRRQNRFNNWVKVGQHQWGRI